MKLYKEIDVKEEYIEIKGARVNNLKNISLKIPRNKFIVVTGVSGSGKSSLVFNTLYAEGQRRYVESLSSYARQFLGKMDKPQVDSIKGIPPAIAIEQRTVSNSSRSTVGTSTEIYHYLQLLFARIGKIYSPISDEEVMAYEPDDVLKAIISKYKDSKLVIAFKLEWDTEDSNLEILKSFKNKGFRRIFSEGKYYKLESIESEDLLDLENSYIVVDRLQVSEENNSRLEDSIRIAYTESNGRCSIILDDSNVYTYTNQLELDGIQFIKPSVRSFSFNNPIGACEVCEGYGRIIGIDKKLVIPNKNLSIYEGAISCWKGEKMSYYNEKLIMNAHKFDFPIHKPYKELSRKEKKLLWRGNKYFIGLNEFFNELESKKYKIQNRVFLSRYKGKTLCPECHGTRLKKETSYVKINNKNIQELVQMPIDELLPFFNEIELNSDEKKITKHLLPEIKNRLNFINKVGLGYLNLNRLSNTLSGGEAQRINLATFLSSSLVGALYILDEPSIGLHPRDTALLIEVLKGLRDIGNTVIVVEHDEDIMRNADEIIDIGPYAGSNGGELMFQGVYKENLNTESLTYKYLSKELQINQFTDRKVWNSFIKINHIKYRNLNNINVKIPLNVLTCISGVSGSGKSSLINDILIPSLRKYIDTQDKNNVHFKSISGDIDEIKDVECINQNPIGTSSRSTPATYLKIWDDVRKIYASLPQSKLLGYKTSHFSFNMDGGRCPFCNGEGIIKVEMQFLSDIYLKCEHCKGMRFKEEILQIKYNGKNIYDILEMTVSEAIDFFSKDKTNTKIIKKLQCLNDSGLEYIKLGQTSNTLSGGENQRIKLAYILSKESSVKTLFAFDEPTTGLHFNDISKLIKSLKALVDRGHTVIVIEHNLDVLRNSDHIIDLGPESGTNGGNIVFSGTPEELKECKESITAKYI